jgi:hypothetical protein
MAYLGNAPARSFISFERQVFTIVNSQTAYTLDHSVNNENDIRLVVNNIVQEPGSGKAYTASGTTLTLSAALVNGTDEMYCVFLGRAVATNAPGAGSVNTAAIADLNVTTAKISADAITEAKIADDAVESEHLNDNVISGQTELAAEPADTDEFLISDAGTLKRLDYSYIKGGGKILQVAQGAHTSQASMTGTTFVDVSTNTNVNFTCSATSSKVLILAHFNECYYTGTQALRLRVTAGGSEITKSQDVVYLPGDGNEKLFNQHLTFLYSPNSTSQIEYKLQFSSSSSSEVRVNQNSSAGGSTITLLEVGA